MILHHSCETVNYTMYIFTLYQPRCHLLSALQIIANVAAYPIETQVQKLHHLLGSIMKTVNQHAVLYETPSTPSPNTLACIFRRGVGR